MNLSLIKRQPDVIFEFPHRVFRAYLLYLHPEERRIVMAYLNNLTDSDEEIARKLGLPVQVCVMSFFGAFQKLVKGLALANARRSRAARKRLRALRAEMQDSGGGMGE